MAPVEYVTSDGDISDSDGRTLYDHSKPSSEARHFGNMPTLGNNGLFEPGPRSSPSANTIPGDSKFGGFPPACRWSIAAWFRVSTERPPCVTTNHRELYLTRSKDKAYWVRVDRTDGSLEPLQVRYIGWPGPKLPKERDLKVIVAKGRQGEEFIIGKSTCAADGDRADFNNGARRYNTYSEWVGVDVAGRGEVNVQGYLRPLSVIEKRYDYDLETFNAPIAHESRQFVDNLRDLRCQSLHSTTPIASSIRKRPSYTIESNAQKRQKQGDSGDSPGTASKSRPRRDPELGARAGRQNQNGVPAARQAMMPPRIYSHTSTVDGSDSANFRRLRQDDHGSPELPLRSLLLLNHREGSSVTESPGTSSSNGVHLTSVEASVPNDGNLLLDAHIQTHLSFRFEEASDGAQTPQHIIEQFEFEETDIKSLNKLCTAAAVAGVFEPVAALAHDRLLELTIPGVKRSIKLRMGDRIGRDFARFREALRGASCWMVDEEGVLGDCVVDVKEYRIKILAVD